MSVSAIIVTRGDQDLTEVLASIPDEWERIVWDNGAEAIAIDSPRTADGYERRLTMVSDCSVFGRYAAIQHAAHDLIYVQDDDCVVSDPDALVRRWRAALGNEWDKTLIPGVVCNMPTEFRHGFYEEHALVGFGAMFHRDAPARAFGRYELALGGGNVSVLGMIEREREFFMRTCDIVFTGLTPRVLVDVPKRDMPWAHYESRMWKQPGHMAERVRMLDLVRQVASA